MRGFNDVVKSAKTTIGTMRRRVVTNKIILFGIIFVLVFAIALILYFAFAPAPPPTTNPPTTTTSMPTNHSH